MKCCNKCIHCPSGCIDRHWMILRHAKWLAVTLPWNTADGREGSCHFVASSKIRKISRWSLTTHVKKIYLHRFGSNPERYDIAHVFLPFSPTIIVRLSYSLVLSYTRHLAGIGLVPPHNIIPKSAISRHTFSPSLCSGWRSPFGSIGIPGK